MSPIPGRTAVFESYSRRAVGELPEVIVASGSMGPYELVCQLATGGMGTVYVAKQVYAGGVSRIVALKTLHPHLAIQRRYIRMFTREVQIAAQISHPYVCRVSDIGQVGDVPYVAMEYLIGEPLSRIWPLVARNQSHLATVCMVRAVALMCEGLHAAHGAIDLDGEPMNVVHRDISPDNLVLLYDGTVRVVDFGVAVSDVTDRTTLAGNIKGKCPYMSPEQVQAMPTDRRTDIWSIGVVLWEMLTGRSLFARENDVHTAVAIVAGEVPPPSAFNPHVPRELDNIVLRAIRVEREARYPTAMELSVALHRWVSRSVGAVPPDTVSQWLESLFPNSRAFRQQIVRNSRLNSDHSAVVRVRGIGSLATTAARSTAVGGSRAWISRVLRSVGVAGWSRASFCMLAAIAILTATVVYLVLHMQSAVPLDNIRPQEPPPLGAQT